MFEAVTSILLQSPSTAQLVIVWVLHSLFSSTTTTSFASVSETEPAHDDHDNSISVVYATLWVHLLKFIPAGLSYIQHSSTNPGLARRHAWNASALGLTSLLSCFTALSLMMLLLAIQRLKSSPVSALALVIVVPSLLSTISQTFDQHSHGKQPSQQQGSQSDLMISISACLVGIIFIVWDARDDSLLSIFFSVVLVTLFSFLSLLSIRVRKLLHHKNPDLVDSTNVELVATSFSFCFSLVFFVLFSPKSTSSLSSVFSTGPMIKLFLASLFAGSINQTKNSGGKDVSSSAAQIVYYVLLLLFFFATSLTGHFTVSSAISLAIAIAVSEINLATFRPRSRSRSFSMLPSYVGDDVSNANATLGQKTLVVLRHILSEKDSSKIFIFLVINFSFMFVELFVGYWSNSLGLISDAAHMLFDCVALVIGLYASYIAKLKANDIYTYGYGRYEVIAGLSNGIFLIFIAFSVIVESIERVFNPPDINSERLLLVSIVGLGVNAIGILFFHEAHAHGPKSSSSSSHENGHGHSHSHGGHAGHNQNLEGIFLHVLADALGSFGVIVSSLLVQQFGWLIADPICSILISILILVSVYPLIRETVLLLLQRIPTDVALHANHALVEILNLEGVKGYCEPQFWEVVSGSLVGSIHVHVEERASEQKLLTEISDVIAREIHPSQLTVQLEKDMFLSNLDTEKRLRYHYPS
eukprot:TRINITY_DN54024_c0_g1_i1.p1 TRINITY_DN54024_c0_g1~~TRINITY_DN54024_c0_g1_i1.p1  ORF type:complete len:698 (+),score=143.42 TRINITY_DN54024_c0_g1_i1:1-2094(+)